MGNVGSWLGTGIVVAGLGLLPPLGSCALSKQLGELQGGEGGYAAEGGDADQGENTGGTGFGGTTNSAGSGGGNPAPQVSGVECDWQTALQKSCAISVCHGTRMPFGDLNLTPDGLLVSRVKDVTVTLGDLDCDPSAEYHECVSPPPECTEYVGAKLVDSVYPEASFILAKLRGSGCGNQMPMPPGDAASAGWNAERRACLESLVQGIAALP
jgi:hypothetical protein